jgi:hypothetical protein
MNYDPQARLDFLEAIEYNETIQWHYQIQQGKYGFNEAAD